MGGELSAAAARAVITVDEIRTISAAVWNPPSYTCVIWRRTGGQWEALKSPLPPKESWLGSDEQEKGREGKRGRSTTRRWNANYVVGLFVTHILRVRMS